MRLALFFQLQNFINHIARTSHKYTYIIYFNLWEINLLFYYFKILFILVIISVQIHLLHNIIIHFHLQIHLYHHLQVQQLMLLCLLVFNLWIVLYGNYAQVGFGFRKKSLSYVSVIFLNIWMNKEIFDMFSIIYNESFNRQGQRYWNFCIYIYIFDRRHDSVMKRKLRKLL